MIHPAVYGLGVVVPAYIQPARPGALSDDTVTSAHLNP